MHPWRLLSASMLYDLVISRGEEEIEKYDCRLTLCRHCRVLCSGLCKPNLGICSCAFYLLVLIPEWTFVPVACLALSIVFYLYYVYWSAFPFISEIEHLYIQTALLHLFSIWTLRLLSLLYKVNKGEKGDKWDKGDEWDEGEERNKGDEWNKGVKRHRGRRGWGAQRGQRAWRGLWVRRRPEGQRRRSGWMGMRRHRGRVMYDGFSCTK